MKKYFTLIATSIFYMLPTLVNAQGIYQFWGTTTKGGKDFQGSFFSTKFDGTGFTNKPYFTAPYSGKPEEGNKPVAYGGKFYSVLAEGGVNNDGIISEYDPATNVYTTKVNFYDLHTGEASNALVQLGTKLYGVTYGYLAERPSQLYEFNPATGAAVVKHTFEQATGYLASNEPVNYNGKLYGIAASGGTNNKGVIYEYNPANNTYSVKHNFTAALASVGLTGLTLYDNKLWGFGNNGFIFSFDPANNIISQKKSIGAFGSTAFSGELVVLNNKLYGVASDGGPVGDGLIFCYTPLANTIEAEFYFNDATANFRFSLLSHNGLLYGSSLGGGVNNEGVLFSYNPVSNIYTSITSFKENAEGRGVGALTVYNNKLYGWLSTLDNKGSGNMFEYDLNTNIYSMKIKLGDNKFVIPQGALVEYKNKLYGAAADGGTLRDGGIYAYDLQTKNFEVKVNMDFSTGKFYDQGGFLLYNDVMYGVTSQGGANSKGALFSYDPNNNVYTLLHSFDGTEGSYPQAKLVLFNGKIYGLCRSGGFSDKGTLFEFNPANGSVVTKVSFDVTRGALPSADLTVFHSRLFGVTEAGGVNDDGVLFEYLPLPNALVKLADFNKQTTGQQPTGKLLGYDNKLWGTSTSGVNNFSSFVYQYDLATGVLNSKKELTGESAEASLTYLNKKFYGLTTMGGSTNSGVLYEYDPITNSEVIKTDLHPLQGKYAGSTQLTKVPAPAAPGSLNACDGVLPENSMASNANEWIAFTDAQGRAVAEINANGNILGRIDVSFYINDGPLRKKNGFSYLDRNITITSENTPQTPVSVRLYVSKAEFDQLKNEPGSGLTDPSELSVYKNDDRCSGVLVESASKLPSTQETWGFDYVYSTEVSSFSSFYFAADRAVLPVKMIYFKGATETLTNKLEWKSACTNEVDFIIEKSTDGIHFDSIDIKKVQQMECNNPFIFYDDTPAAVSYYRLKIVEANAVTVYSNIILLQRNGGTLLEIKVLPNPVTGSEARLQITAGKKQNVNLKLADAMGKIVLQKNISVAAGISQLNLMLPNISKGVYYFIYGDDKFQKTFKLIKQ